MRVLIIEDTETKARKVEEQVRRNIDSNLITRVDVVETLSESVAALERDAFNLIVLDLMVPFIPDGVADRGSGLELLRHIRSKSCKSRDALVIGLSAFPEEMNAARAAFERFAVVILEFDSQGVWEAAFALFCEDAARLAARSLQLDFLVFVALEEELQPFRDTALEWEGRAIVEGLNVQFVRLSAPPARGAIIKLRRMGLVAATLDAALAIPAFRPRVVAMAGICAGFSERADLGQLIVASPAWEYQAGKWSEGGFQIEPYQVSLRPQTKGICEQTLNREGFVQQLEAIAKFDGDRPSRCINPAVAPGVTGSAVIADSGRLEVISTQHRKLAALDMETYGIYAAANECSWLVPHFFSVKCVVDLADKEKSDDLHSYGAAMAALACVEILGPLLAD